MHNKDIVPQHIAIIMDGNGRWAKEKGLSRTAGHREGTKRVKEIVKAAAELGIKVLTLFAFSAENWSRSKGEINMLMRTLKIFLDREVKELNKNNVRFRVIGRAEPLPRYILKKINDTENRTKENTGLIFVLALNYGARQEIVDAVKNFTQAVINGKAHLEDLDENSFSDYFYTKGLPDPDLLIRTSGELRLSNFLLWQLSYAELYFPKKYWPDFKRYDLELAIRTYQNRERRFGKEDVGKKDN